MSRRLTLAVAVAAGCTLVAGVLAGAGTRPSGRLEAVGHRSSRLSEVQRWARSAFASAPAGTVAGQAAAAFRQAATRVTGGGGPQDAAPGTPATSGGVIPLETVPIDQLSEWELDLLTTPDT